MDVEREIHDLKRRVGDLEGAMNVLNGHVGQLHPDLTTLTSATQTRFDTLDETMLRVFARLDTMNTQVWSLRDDMPVLIADAMRRVRRSME